MGTKKCFVSPMVWPNYNMMTKLKWAKLRIGHFTVWSETVHLVYGWLHASKVPQKPFLFFFRLIRSLVFWQVSNWFSIWLFSKQRKTTTTELTSQFEEQHNEYWHLANEENQIVVLEKTDKKLHDNWMLWYRT